MVIKSDIGEFNSLISYLEALKGEICEHLCKYHDLPADDPQSCLATEECPLNEIM